MGTGDDRDRPRRTRLKWLLGLSLVAILAADTIVAVHRHASGADKRTHFFDAHAQLPPGPKRGVYDAKRHSLWILTRDESANASGRPRVSLTEFDVRTSKQTSVQLRPDGSLWNAADILVDDNGIVWAGWGRDLVSYDPSGGTESDYVVPAPARAGHAPAQVPKITSLAVVPNGIAVSLLSTKQLYVLSMTTKRWSPWYQTKVTANVYTHVRLLPDGRIAVNGTLVGQGVQNASSRLVLIKDGVPQVASPSVWGYQIGESGILAFVTNVPQQTRGLTLHQLGFFDVGADKVISVSQASVHVDSGPTFGTLDGLFYVPENGPQGLSLLGLLPGTAAKRYAYPIPYTGCPKGLYVGPTGSPAPLTNCIPDPGFEDFVAGDGHLGILTHGASASKQSLGYAPLIEFDPS